MSNQIISADNHSLKLTFSNLHCKINLSDTSLFAFVIRIGKTSSKYTQKKEIVDGILDFDCVLELPINQSYFQLKNPKKEKVPYSLSKCEIMLYKFRLNREKQLKELVGMASVTVASEMFEGQSKKLRLTNSFDKEAFVQSHIKIQLGQAEVLSYQLSQMSSFNLKSEEHSLNNQLTESRLKQKIGKSSYKNHVKIGLITSNSRKSLRQVSSERSKEDNSFLELLTRTENQSPLVSPSNIQSETIIKQQQSPVKIELFDSHSQQIEQENYKLKQICKQLEQQNKTLKTTIQILQNQVLNQSIISNRSASLQNPQIPKPGGINKRSPMIKKNTTITFIPSFSKLHPNGNFLTEDLANPTNQHQIQVKPKGPKKGQIIRSQGSKLDNSRANENEKSLYFQQRGSRIIQQTLKFQHQNLEMPLHLTFAGQRLTKRNRFSVMPVVQVKYTPVLNYEQGSNGINKSIVHSSISELERRNCRSYTRFNGKKKYQIIGAIKNQEDNSQLNMSAFDTDLYKNCKRQGGSIIVGKYMVLNQNEQKSFHFNNPKQMNMNGVKLKIDEKENNFLDFLKENDQKFRQKKPNDLTSILQSKASQTKLPTQEEFIFQEKKEAFGFVDGNGQRKSRLTLEDLDIKTEEMFRRNQRDLKISNMKITEENRKLKEDKKMLEQEIQRKNGLSQEQFEFLKKQLSHLKVKIQQSEKIKEQSMQKCSQMSSRFTSLQEQNMKLKKDLKQQRAKYDYYFKMSNINDDKEKDRENIGPWEKSLTSKKSTDKLHSETSSPGEVSKTLSRNDRSMTSISNFNKEDGLKLMNQENKSFKKVDFSLERHDHTLEGISSKKVEKHEQESSKSATWSTAVSKLKMHIKPSIPKSPMSGLLSQIRSPTNSIGSQGIVSGLIGTGQTIVEGQKSTNFFPIK